MLFLIFSTMADISKYEIRSVAAYLQDTVQTLYTQIAAIYGVTQTWTLNQSDLLLPPVTAVQIQLASYKNLSVPYLSLSASLRKILQAESVIPDALILDQPLYFSGDAPIIFQ